MRSAVDAILRFNRGFDPASLVLKREKMSASSFAFFRGTFHLFASDLTAGPFRKWPVAEAVGPIIGDLHTENFGTFRSVTGEVVYDINDFDETTSAPYEFDLRRMATALVLASLDASHAFGHGVLLAETFVRTYLDALHRLGRLKHRREFERLPDRHDVRKTLALASEQSRVEMMRRLAAESTRGRFVLQRVPRHLKPAGREVAAAVAAAFPQYIENCKVRAARGKRKYRIEDVAFRFAGCGSLGRRRYALLLSKGEGEASWETLRLVEWKDSLDSALDAQRPQRSRGRAKQVIENTLAFQLHPKRYLGYTRLAKAPVQGREIGANDARFPHREFTAFERFEKAAAIFGEITARAHLLATIGKSGPRALLGEIAGHEDRFVHRVLAFAAAYAGQTMDDFHEFQSRRAEIEKAWKSSS